MLNKSVISALNASAKKLHSQTNAHVKYIRQGQNEILQITSGKIKLEFKIEYTDRLSDDNIDAVINYMGYKKETYILLTKYINKKHADKLFDAEIAHIDFSGNIYINNPKLFIHIKGQPRSKQKISSTNYPIFNVAGIKVIFALLCNDNLENETYRKISSISLVSRGAIDNIFSSLKQFGYLITKEKQRILINKPELIQRWCIAYAERLRPKLVLNTYTCDIHNWWENVDLSPHNALWSGEVAATKLTRQLKPGSVSIFCDTIPSKLLADYALRTRPDGDITILKTFWNFQTPEEANSLTPNLLTYAELVISGDDRNKEIAEIIYEKYLA